MAEKKSKIFVRSILDLGDFCDHTVNNEPSLTDPEQDEPIGRLVQRLIRGEQVSSRQVYYDEIGPETALGDAFESQAPTERDGFDLADVGPILERGNSALKEVKHKKSTPKPVEKPAEQKPPAEPPATPPGEPGK